MLVVQLVFGVLVFLGIGLIPYLIAHQLLVFLLWKEIKKERKEERGKKEGRKEGEKEGERKDHHS